MGGGRVISLVLVLLHAAPAASEVVINEVFYDPRGRDDGFEFVELHNPGDLPVGLAGWTLETGNGLRENAWTLEWTGSSGDSVNAGGFFVVGEESLGSCAQAITGLDLQNGPDGCRLKGPLGELDVVGWGDLTFAEYYEGAPCKDVSSGLSLGRDPDGQDTEQNCDDLRAMENPSPGEYNRPPFDLLLHRAGLSRYGESSGATIDVVCSLKNAGTRTCGAGARLFASIAGFMDSTYIATDIEPGGVTKAVVRIPNPSPGIYPATVWHEYEADRWNTNDTLRMSVVLHPAPVVVNEIMFDPGVADCEWVEVFNGGPDPVNLAGWVLHDHKGRPKDIAREDLWLFPGGFVVLVEDEEVFARKHPGVDPGGCLRPAGGWPILNDSDGPLDFADMVVLRDTFGTMIDSVAYRERWSKTGVSTERINPEACSWSAGNWSPHFGVATGSPGARNSVSICLPTGDKLLSLEPRAFSPDNDGMADMLAVSVTLPGPGLARVLVFDANGSLVTRLVDGEVIETNRVTFWNGTRSDEAEAPTGIYIVLLEARMLSSGETYRSRAPVVLVRK
jgi:hypothetical protein